MVTVRSEDKGKRIIDAHPDTRKEKLSYVIVKDVAADGAFDEVIDAICLNYTHSTVLMINLFYRLSNQTRHLIMCSTQHHLTILTSMILSRTSWTLPLKEPREYSRQLKLMPRP